MPGNSNYADDLTATTFEIFMQKRTSDVIFGDLALWKELAAKERITKQGGLKILTPIMYAKSTAVGFYSGADLLDISEQSGLTDAEFDWKQAFGSVTIPNDQVLKNRGEAQMVNLLLARITQAETSLADMFDQAAFLDGTAGNGKGFVGLALMVDSTGTYGNIVRSSNSWWASVETAVSGGLGLGGTTGLRRAFNDCSLGQGRMKPNMLMTTQAIFEQFEALMDPYMRFTAQSNSPGNAGTSFNWKGANVYYDDYCQSGVLYLLNTKTIHLVEMESRGAGVVSEEGDRDVGAFRLGPWQQPPNQDVKTALMFYMGNFANDNCRFNGKLTGIS